MLGGGDLNPQEQSQLILVEKSLFMRRINLTFGQNGDEVKPLTTNEIKPLSEDERRTLFPKEATLVGSSSDVDLITKFLRCWQHGN